MAIATANALPRNPGWLVGRDFDTFLIAGTTVFALSLGLLAIAGPGLLVPIVVLNIWLFGYHHVIATFTRLCFDKESHARSWPLIYLLFPGIMIAMMSLYAWVGPWAITSLYLYVQWFHYARQSWGISRAYERNAPEGYAADRSWQTQAAFYGVPLLGILYWSYRAPETFLGIPLKVVPISFEMLMAATVVCGALLVMWGVRVWRDWRRGVLPPAYSYFMASHFMIFGVAYLLMPSLDSGWLVANVWHNLQYLLFVWAFNRRRFAAGPDAAAPMLSRLSQPRHMLLYFAVTLALTFVVYGAMNLALSTVLAFVPVLVLYQTVNFHHYIVDAIIWRQAWIRRGARRAAAA